MIVEVTQEDVLESQARYCVPDYTGICKNCPVAVALQRYFPEFSAREGNKSVAWTDSAHMGLFDMSRDRCLEMPEHVSLWIAKYDHAYNSKLSDNPLPFPDTPLTFEVPDIYIRWQMDLLAAGVEYPEYS